jgi:hypothetical protein
LIRYVDNLLLSAVVTVDEVSRLTNRLQMIYARIAWRPSNKVEDLNGTMQALLDSRET